LKYVLLCEEKHIPVRQVARENNIPYGTLDGWVRKYQTGGAQALNPEKVRSGNRFSALHTSKSLSEIDRLRLLVEKLEIENERLKKGYIVKGVGVNKEFVTLKEWNSKS
jgi:transposase-like protein